MPIFWRIARIIGSFVGLLFFVFGLGGTGDDLERWKEWITMFGEVVAIDPLRAGFIVAGAGIIIVLSVPVRAWRALLGRRRFAVTPPALAAYTIIGVLLSSALVMAYVWGGWRSLLFLIGGQAVFLGLFFLMFKLGAWSVTWND